MDVSPDQDRKKHKKHKYKHRSREHFAHGKHRCPNTDDHGHKQGQSYSKEVQREVCKEKLEESEYQKTEHSSSNYRKYEGHRKEKFDQDDTKSRREDFKYKRYKYSSRCSRDTSPPRKKADSRRENFSDRDPHKRSDRHAHMKERCRETEHTDADHCKTDVACGSRDRDHCSSTTSTEKPTKGPRESTYSSSSDGSSDTEHTEDINLDKLDCNFDWEAHRSALNKLFFREEDLIKRGSPSYEDFWSFLKKYQAFQRKKALQHMTRKRKKKTSTSGKLGLPGKYDKRYRINVSLLTKDMEPLTRHSKREGSEGLTQERVSQFRAILLHYLDFTQKQKFTKLVKIRKDQQNLPIYQYREQIIDTIRSYQVVMVPGDTGCGKSTQVPQYLMAAGFERIACTQPRRIACISLSKRVGYETLNEYGSQVGFQVRFEKSKTAATRILFLTEGLLLRQMSTDPQLSQYSVIVIDEVHERHINTDFLLGVLKYLLKQRSDLKLVLMSATINIKLFSNYFDDCPVVKVPGRLYPIQLEYKPIKQEEKTSRSERLDPSPYLRIMQLINHKYPDTERGDLLVFLSGMSEIMAVVEAARLYAQQTKRWIVLPLHSALSVSEQDKVFDIAPEGVRKVIVSTNIAETSVTIDGVRFIVDSGKVKEMSFDAKYKMQRLKEFWISRASAEQRKGRAGRTGPGVCYRLYDESDYQAFDEYSTPEILRVPLDSLILQMLAMGLPDARKFPFIEAPSMAAIENSIAFLRDQKALSEEEKLTPIGEMLSRLPVDVVIGKMLIMGSIYHMIDPVLSIAAALSVQSPFTSRAHTDYDAISARKPLESDHGDPFTLMNAFDEWIQVKARGDGTRKWCKRRGLEEQRFYEMSKLKQQFKELLRDHGLLVEEHEQQTYLMATERRQRHADRKRLGQLRREQQKEIRRLKVLKLENENYEVESEGEDDGGDDVKDLEFRLSNDLNQLQERSNTSRSFTLRDINLLKVILCSGLYPQVAIADEHNSFRADSDQAYHTKSKPFVLLHPTSVFASHPEVLELKERDVHVESGVGGSDTRQVFSSKHELLAYVCLLETTKPYLVGGMRVPALQTMLLYANSLDTSSTCTRVLCDGWLEVQFKDPETAESIISSVVQLRSASQDLVKLKLKDTFSHPQEASTRQPSVKARRLERLMATKLTEFLDSQVLYSVRRVLPAEVKTIYAGPQEESSVSEVLQDIIRSTGKVHPIKGGIQVNEYLTYNCLLEDSSASGYGEYSAYLQKHWTCSHCGTSMVVTMAEKLVHEQQCGSQKTTEETPEEIAAEEKEAQLNPLRKPFHCPQCAQDFSFTTTEILKHRKTCKPVTD